MNLKQLLLVPAFLSLFGCNLHPPIIEDNTDDDTTEEEEPVERNDLVSNLNLKTYKVGDAFSYSGAVQNNSNGIITIDNQDGNSLEYMLMLGTEKVDSVKSNASLYLELKDAGNIGFNHENNKLKVTMINVYAEYNGKSYDIPYPLRASKTGDINNFVFNKSGDYQMQVRVKYSLEGNQYETVFKSQEFKVE
jgi:hypothetical protein